MDRNCHKSHHYGFVLAGAQPVYLEAFPLTDTPCTAACRCGRSRRRCWTCRPRASWTGSRMVDLTNCTFDGHMYNPQPGHGGVPRHQARPYLPLGRGLVRLRPIFAYSTAGGRPWPRPPRWRPVTGTRRTARNTRHSRSKLGGSTPTTRSCWTAPVARPGPGAHPGLPTHSTHKSMSAFRQGSMILVYDRIFTGWRSLSRRPTSPTPRPRPTCRLSPPWTWPVGKWSSRGMTWS